MRGMAINKRKPKIEAGEIDSLWMPRFLPEAVHVVETRRKGRCNPNHNARSENIGSIMVRLEIFPWS
jgi:hypothetical protein